MKNIALFIGIPLLVVGLLAWGRASKGNAPLAMVPGTNVACLPNGHQQLDLHIHPLLSISVDGEEEAIPANIGITSTCMAEIHTHDASGQLHVETTSQERFEQIAFKDFFDVWEMPLEREGYSLQIRYEGNIVDDVSEVLLTDLAHIELMYTSQGNAS